MANNIIDRSDSGIVVTETKVVLSDEKLKGALSKTYEQAQKDILKPKFHKWYNVFLSIAGTLFLTLLTSNFNDIVNISSKTVTIIAWILCGICAILGFILMGLHVSDKIHNNTNERDKAVDEIFNQYCLKNK